ncbi:DUF3005 domain-containing protein [Burkholderia sp. BCC1977]|uniref:DUF3005 domain-containing protein n=1 Tax=Burkholderia sp. BCC1977 TaxID=2817440 RepID=UPI002ABE5CF3|nr:DUF3005 domain-containing protein [Burkholderia sp. BCC1977]
MIYSNASLGDSVDAPDEGLGGFASRPAGKPAADRTARRLARAPYGRGGEPGRMSGMARKAICGAQTCRSLVKKSGKPAGLHLRDVARRATGARDLTGAAPS